MHVLITGGAGFVGSHLVEALLREGHRVTVLDNFAPFYPRAVKERNIAAARSNSAWRMVEADLRNVKALAGQLTDRYDVIVHLAAKAGVRPSIQDPQSYQEVNVAGTQNLLEDALGKKAIIERLPEQPGDVPQTWADISKARRLLGYEPRTSYREGVGKFCHWLESEP